MSGTGQSASRALRFLCGKTIVIRHGARGFTFIWMLFVVAALGIGMATLGKEWHTLAVREKEQDLLFVGDQYRQAITAFFRGSPKGQERYPKNLAELLEDPRFPNTVRYLRRPYHDPITGSAKWGLEKTADGMITGVYSLSEGQPIKVANFPARDKDFEGSTRYRDWLFSAISDPSGGSAGAGNVPSGVPRSISGR